MKIISPFFFLFVFVFVVTTMQNCLSKRHRGEYKKGSKEKRLQRDYSDKIMKTLKTNFILFFLVLLKLVSNQQDEKQILSIWKPLLLRARKGTIYDPQKYRHDSHYK